MKNGIKRYFALVCILALAPSHSFCSDAGKKNKPAETSVTEITTIEGLAEYAGRDNVQVRMAPGVYTIADDRLSQQMTLKKARGDGFVDYPVAALIHFSGNNSVYRLEGVQIEIEGAMHRAFPRRHLFEIFVSGNGNTISGLSVRDLGDVDPVMGAIMMHVSGDDNLIENVQLNIRGSYPYGYGHLLGKGSKAIVNARKHSSLLVTGVNTTLDGCRVITRAFGHGIVMQGAVNTTLRNCYVEGEMRPTDEMLAETSGPAFDAGFRSDYPPGMIVPGEIKALPEDGIRSYPDGYQGRATRDTEVENCTVKNMRSGFDLSAQGGTVRIRGCTAIGCQEKGYSLPSGGVIEKSRGDAMYGPLITFITKDIKNCTVELELTPETGGYPVPRLAEINGSGHRITLTAAGGKRPAPAPIVFGESFWADVHKFREPARDITVWSGATGIELVNRTGMPVVLTRYSKTCNVETDGSVEDLGTGNTVIQ